MFSVSEASEKDISAIVDIAHRTWWPAYGNILSADQIRYMLSTLYADDKIREQIATKDQTYLVLRDEHGAQGFASFGKRAAEPSVYKLHKLYVLPENHGKGYGKALIAEIQARLREAGIRMLDLNVNRFNDARSFYEKLGFKVIREEDLPIGPYWMNDYVMRLPF